MTDIGGRELTSADRQLLLEENVGGVILFSRNYESPQQIIELVQEIRNLKSPPLLVAVDQEGGRVQRLRDGFTLIPAMRKIGRLYEMNAKTALKISETAGWIIGAELRSADLNSAPIIHPAVSDILSAVFAFISYKRPIFRIAGIRVKPSRNLCTLPPS